MLALSDARSCAQIEAGRVRSKSGLSSHTRRSLNFNNGVYLFRTSRPIEEALLASLHSEVGVPTRAHPLTAPRTPPAAHARWPCVLPHVRWRMAL